MVAVVVLGRGRSDVQVGVVVGNVGRRVRDRRERTARSGRDRVRPDTGEALAVRFDDRESLIGPRGVDRGTHVATGFDVLVVRHLRAASDRARKRVTALMDRAEVCSSTYMATRLVEAVAEREAH